MERSPIYSGSDTHVIKHTAVGEHTALVRCNYRTDTNTFQVNLALQRTL